MLLLVAVALILPGWLSSPSPVSSRLMGEAVAPRLIDLNHSPWYELTLLSGIGEARARRIVEFRRQHGRFQSLGELEEIPGMPRGWTEKVRPFITLNRDDTQQR